LSGIRASFFDIKLTRLTKIGFFQGQITEKLKSSAACPEQKPLFTITHYHERITLAKRPHLHYLQAILATPQLWQ
jgi:hypothetical protein